MLTEALLIVGAGGHAKVVIDAIRCLHGADCLLQLVDDDLRLVLESVMGLPVIVPVATGLGAGRRFHVAIGGNLLRARVAQDCLRAGLQYQTVVHPWSIVAASATLGQGCFVAGGGVVGPEASLGEGCIVNHGAVVDHDCRIGDFCHIGPNATLAGKVQLGAQVLIGAGANILPGVSVGDGCVVGAGAVVLHDMPAGTTYVGVPARRIQE